MARWNLPIISTTCYSSQDEGSDGGQTDREQAEGIASLYWQRKESGRISHQETGRQMLTSTPHRLTTLQEAAARAGRDSDNDEGRDIEGIL